MPYEILEETAPGTGLENKARRHIHKGYKPVPEEEAVTLPWLDRSGARTLARVAESIAGLPGDISAGVLGLANIGLEKATGKRNILPPQLAPTSEDIREYITKPLTGESLEPQNEYEKFYDDIIGDAAAILVPVKGKIPFKQLGSQALRSLGIAAAGNTGKILAEQFTDNPIITSGAKVGSMLLASLKGGRPKLEQMEKSFYEEAERGHPDITTSYIKPAENKINRIIKSLEKGDRTDKDFLLERFNKFTPLVDNGVADMKELINLKTGWNDYIGNPKIPIKTRNFLKRGVGILNESINKYGKRNPKFGIPWKKAEELHGALRSTNYVAEFLSKHPLLEKSMSNPIIKYGLFGGLVHKGIGLTSLPWLAAAGAGLYAGKEGFKFLNLVTKSPIAAKTYKEFIKHSLMNDTKAVARDLATLNKEADKYDESSNLYEIIQ